MEEQRATSWTGTERQRREQGVCLPPARPAVRVPRFLIPAGSSVRVSRVSRLCWRPHFTRKELHFERHEGYRNGQYTFRHQGYLISVWRGLVHHREDGYPRPAV
jgi:hypothetical protein